MVLLEWYRRIQFDTYLYLDYILAGSNIFIVFLVKWEYHSVIG